jgi:hypothetical protein
LPSESGFANELERESRVRTELLFWTGARRLSDGRAAATGLRLLSILDQSIMPLPGRDFRGRKTSSSNGAGEALGDGEVRPDDIPSESDGGGDGDRDGEGDLSEPSEVSEPAGLDIPLSEKIPGTVEEAGFKRRPPEVFLVRVALTGDDSGVCLGDKLSTIMGPESDGARLCDFAGEGDGAGDGTDEGEEGVTVCARASVGLFGEEVVGAGAAELEACFCLSASKKGDFLTKVGCEDVAGDDAAVGGSGGLPTGADCVAGTAGFGGVGCSVCFGGAVTPSFGTSAV